jgi:hypothetical protein
LGRSKKNQGQKCGEKFHCRKTELNRLGRQGNQREAPLPSSATHCHRSVHPLGSADAFPIAFLLCVVVAGSTGVLGGCPKETQKAKG